MMTMGGKAFSRFLLALMISGIVLVAVVFGLAVALYNISGAVHEARMYSASNRVQNCVQTAIISAHLPHVMDRMQARGGPCHEVDVASYLKP